MVIIGHNVESVNFIAVTLPFLWYFTVDLIYKQEDT